MLLYMLLYSIKLYMLSKEFRHLKKFPRKFEPSLAFAETFRSLVPIMFRSGFHMDIHTRSAMNTERLDLCASALILSR